MALRLGQERDFTVEHLTTSEAHLLLPSDFPDNGWCIIVVKTPLEIVSDE